MIVLPTGCGMVVGVGNSVYKFIKRVWGICHGIKGNLSIRLVDPGQDAEIAEIVITPPNQQADAKKCGCSRRRRPPSKMPNIIDGCG